MPKLLLLSLTTCLMLAGCNPTASTPSTPSQPTAAAESKVSSDVTMATAADGHTNANSLDWAGEYKGVVPCADCEGIETSLTLNRDTSYQLSTSYLGKDATAFKQQGHFEWNNTGSIVQLLQQKDGPAWYKVVENQLIQLDMAGQLITGDLAENYKLTKQNPVKNTKLTGARWKLSELMGQQIAATEPDTTPYLEFAEDGKVSGFTGCNQFSGTYQVQGLRLSLHSVAATEKACLNASTEQQFLTTLQSIDNYSLNDSALAFYKARTAALLRFTQEQP